jgi:putative FmdB family regulatory protein
MTYEYVCTACQHAWEAEQRISEAPLTSCPSCHQEAAKRQVSGGAGFILKGSGWYADLYSSAKPAKKEDGSGETKKADSGESKKDSGGESKTSSDSAATKPAATPADSGSSVGTSKVAGATPT